MEDNKKLSSDRSLIISFSAPSSFHVTDLCRFCLSSNLHRKSFYVKFHLGTSAKRPISASFNAHVLSRARTYSKG